MAYPTKQLEWMGGKTASYFPDEFKYLVIQTADQEDQDLSSLFKRTSAFIDSGVRAGGVLVHCFAGVSRSSTVVAAYLMDRHQMTAKDALVLV
jgi:dual specificity phosphatase 12